MNNKPFTVAGFIQVAPRGPQGKYSASYNHQNRHRRVSLKTRDRGMARRRAEALAAKILSGEEVRITKQIRFTEAIEIFIDGHRAESKSKKTEDKYKAELDTLAADAEKHGVVVVGKYTAMDFHRYRGERSRKLSAYTLYNHGIIAKQFFNKLARLKLIAESPLAGFSMKEPDRVRHPAVTLPQFVQILRVVETPCRPLFATMGMASPRLGEALDIRVEDVDLSARILVINGTKTQAARRSVPIHPSLVPLLTEAIAGRNSGPLFLNPHAPSSGPDKRWNPRRVNIDFQAAATKLNLTVGRKQAGLTTHSLRRFFGTTVAMAGVDIAIRKLWMGTLPKTSMITTSARLSRHRSRQSSRFRSRSSERKRSTEQMSTMKVT